MLSLSEDTSVLADATLRGGLVAKFRARRRDGDATAALAEPAHVGRRLKGGEVPGRLDAEACGAGGAGGAGGPAWPNVELAGTPLGQSSSVWSEAAGCKFFDDTNDSLQLSHSSAPTNDAEPIYEVYRAPCAKLRVARSEVAAAIGVEWRGSLKLERGSSTLVALDECHQHRKKRVVQEGARRTQFSALRTYKSEPLLRPLGGPPLPVNSGVSRHLGGTTSLFNARPLNRVNILLLGSALCRTDSVSKHHGGGRRQGKIGATKLPPVGCAVQPKASPDPRCHALNLATSPLFEELARGAHISLPALASWTGVTKPSGESDGIGLQVQVTGVPVASLARARDADGGVVVGLASLVPQQARVAELACAASQLGTEALASTASLPWPGDMATSASQPKSWNLLGTASPSRPRRGTIKSKCSIADAEVARTKAAFRRYKVPDSGDLHIEDLGAILQYLGHFATADEGVQLLAKEVTTYEYLDFDEFSAFLRRYVPHQREQLRLLFQRFGDGGGISVERLRNLLACVGVVPSRAAVSEALSTVAARRGFALGTRLDFEACYDLLLACGQGEGFSEAQVAELGKAFDACITRPTGMDKKAEVEVDAALTFAGTLPADALCVALVSFFGQHVMEIAQKLEGRLKSGRGLRKSSFSSLVAGEAPESVEFSEFLIFARKVRETVLDGLRWSFPDWADCHEDADRFAATHKAPLAQTAEGSVRFYDTNWSKRISERALVRVLDGMGHTLLRQNFDEIFAEVGTGRSSVDRRLDFGEFADFILTIRQREGFFQSTVVELRVLFERFDEDLSGEISILELGHLFRHLGYILSLEDLQTFLVTVDANQNNTIDGPEYMWMMRLHREEELQKLRALFYEYTDPSSGMMKEADLIKAVQDLHNIEDPGDPTPEASVHLRRPGRRGALRPFAKEALDFDAFVGVVDSRRAAFVEAERKRAGFSNEEIVEFRQMFNAYDKNRSGDVDPHELLEILKVFGWTPSTPEEQQTILDKLDVARGAARKAGGHDVVVDGSIGFWTFIQLARMLRNEHDCAAVERTALLNQELRFTDVEVGEFRQIYRAAEQSFYSEASVCARERKGLDEDNLDGQPPEAKQQKGIDRSAVRNLLQSLGLAIDYEHIRQLHELLADLEEDNMLHFEGFLKLMRWVLDTDFADVHSITANTVHGLSDT